MPLAIYGNYLSLDAPAGLQVDVMGIEKLYRLAAVDAHGQVAPSLFAGAIVEQVTSTDKREGVPILQEDGTTA